jgi:hypothetical protein
MSLKLMELYTHQNTGVSHTITPALMLMLMPAVHLMRDQKRYENDYRVTMEEPDIDDKDCPKTMVSSMEYIGMSWERPRFLWPM